MRFRASQSIQVIHGPALCSGHWILQSDTLQLPGPDFTTTTELQEHITKSKPHFDDDGSLAIYCQSWISRSVLPVLDHKVVTFSRNINVPITSPWPLGRVNLGKVNI